MRSSQVSLPCTLPPAAPGAQRALCCTPGRPMWLRRCIRGWKSVWPEDEDSHGHTKHQQHHGNNLKQDCWISFFLNQKLRPSPWRKTILHMHHSYTAVAFPPHYLWPPPLFLLSFQFFIVYYLHCKYLMAALLSSLCKNPGLFLGT